MQVGRTPLDEGSACRRDRYLATHSTQQETDILFLVEGLCQHLELLVFSVFSITFSFGSHSFPHQRLEHTDLILQTSARVARSIHGIRIPDLVSTKYFSSVLLPDCRRVKFCVLCIAYKRLLQFSALTLTVFTSFFLCIQF
jgi:hypothetical protein